MKIYTAIPSEPSPTALAVGTFDGVHLGHLALLKRLREVSPHCTVLTFSNHPFEILRPGKAPSPIIPLAEKLSLFEQCGIDAAIAIPFTQEIASLSYEAFLKPFSLTHLLLGSGDAFGKGREGNLENLLCLSEERGFKLSYVDKVLLDGQPISSRRIRTALAANDLELASRLLGRPIRKEPHV